MKSPADIRAKCLRKYPDFLKSLVCAEPFFPLEIQFGKPTTAAGFENLKKDIEALANDDARYQIEWRDVRSPKLGVGRQRLPDRVFFANEQDFLHTIGKGREADQFRRQVLAAREKCPALLRWIAQRPIKVVEVADRWNDLLLVCRYLLDNPRPNRYARELPLPIGTKFIDENRSLLQEMLTAILPTGSVIVDATTFEERFGLLREEPKIRLRILDEKLMPNAWPQVLRDLTVPRSTFDQLAFGPCQVLIVENKLTFVTLPPLPRTIAVFGAGRAVELLNRAEWLAKSDVWYWGDLDVAGFQILDQLRRQFPTSRSIMMDLVTLNLYQALAVPCATPPPELPHLIATERTAYTELAQRGLRLEQEKLPYSWACTQLLNALADRSAAAE